MRVLDIQDLKAPNPPQKSRSTSVKLRFDKQKAQTKTKKKTMIRKC